MKNFFKNLLRMSCSLPVGILDEKSSNQFYIYSNCWITSTLLRLISFNDISTVIVDIFFLVSENQQILKLVYEYQLNALIYFTAEGNGTMLTGIDDTVSGIQALGLLNSSDLLYGPLIITGLALDFCGK